MEHGTSTIAAEKIIQYSRWNNKTYDIYLEKDPNNSNIYTVSASKENKNISYDESKKCFSFANVQFQSVDGRRVLVLKNGEEININANSFYEHVEQHPNGKIGSICITNIAEYIDIIGIYRYIALLVKIECVLDDYKIQFQEICIQDDDTHIWSSYWDEMSDSIKKHKADILDRIKKNNISKTREKCAELEENFLQFSQNVINHVKEVDLTAVEEKKVIYEVARQIEQVIRLYKGGENLMYFRGLGRIIYPEQAGVFRDYRRYEEDRQYKAMKISFPNELSDLRYLDRLAKLQHYELPTRMLDVTSNPLVALYMTCNTIYTGDKEREDQGEVILYFSCNAKERAYDSKALLTVAALVKLSYAEKTNMYKFIRMHEEYLQQFKPDKRKFVKELFNRCIHLACDYGCNTILPINEQETLTNLVLDTGLRVNPSDKTPIDFCWSCMKNIKRPLGDRNWRCIGTTGKKHYTVMVSENDYRYLLCEFVSSYDRLLVTVRRENPAFQNKIDVFTLLQSYHGQFGMTNERILAQSGSFIISGLDHQYINNIMKSTRTDGFIRIIIKDKKAINKQLCLLNITDATMLPDMSHKAHFLDNQLKD